MASNSISLSAVSAVMGLLLDKANFNPSTPNLPQSICIFGEANDANQTGLSTNQVTLTGAKQAGDLYGYGSPIHGVARILFNAGVTIPIIAFPQAAAGGAALTAYQLTTTGTATGPGTIYIVVAVREGIEDSSYTVNINTGDTPTVINASIAAVINGALNCPIASTGTGAVIALSTKWKGLSSDGVNITIDTNNTTTGSTFAIVNTAHGTGTPAVTTSLGYIGNDWRTMIINCYGLVPATMTEFETWNGIPDPTTPTGRYRATVWKPAIVLSGSVLDNPSSITNSVTRAKNVTIVSCVAPLSQGIPYEAAANVAVKLAAILQNNPESDVIGESYVDMPAPLINQVPAMNDQSVRETMVQNGSSTVIFEGGVYKIVDLITTYNPSGEIPPYYRWVRDLNIYANYKFGYRLLEEENLKGKALIPDATVTSAEKVMKPKTWKALVIGYNKDCENRALIVNADINSRSITVTIGAGSNPNRMDTTEKIQISGLGRIYATTVAGGFWFGN